MEDAIKNYNDFKEILGELDLVYEEHEDNKIVVPFNGDDDSFETDLIINIDNEYFIVEALFPTSVPNKRLTEVALYLHLINARVKMGKFIMDMKSGKVAFSTAGLFETTKHHVWRMMGTALNMAEQQIEPVYSVGFGDKDPYDVFEEFFNQEVFKETVEN
ncbi:hypothetical protein ACTHSJ_27545 [Paenibacillus cellulositrophicus]|uniref:hypothetical protein n=1 Tax=Paenibacillus cellulositrophicus TaxID=562959 RepID=UPI003F7F7A42